MDKDNILKLKDGLVEINGEYLDINLINESFDYRDIKAILFIDELSFKNNELKFKKVINVQVKENLYEENETIVLKLGNNIGRGIIKEKSIVKNSKMYIYKIVPTEIYIDGKYETDITKLFKFMSKDNKIYDYENLNNNIRQKFDKLIYSNFKLYYYALIERCKNIKGKNKYAAIASYASLKKYIDELNNDKIYISPPNCYIKGSNVEYDALLTRVNTTDKYLYNKDDVLAIIEIKTCGLICKNDEINQTYNEIIKREKYENISFKYIAFHEFKTSFSKYNNEITNVDQIFLSLKGNSKKINNNEDCGNNQFILPENFCIDKLFENIY